MASSTFSVEKAVSQFTENFYKQLVSQQTSMCTYSEREITIIWNVSDALENTLVSSVSLFVTLMMTWYIAGGKTRKEIGDALTLPEGPVDSNILKSVGSRMKRLQSTGRVNATSYNRFFLFGRNSYNKSISKLMRESADVRVHKVSC